MFAGLSTNGYWKQGNVGCLQKRKEKTSIKPIRVSSNEGKAKWPYVRANQRRNTRENDLGRIQVKFQETA